MAFSPDTRGSFSAERGKKYVKEVLATIAMVAPFLGEEKAVLWADQFEKLAERLDMATDAILGHPAVILEYKTEDYDGLVLEQRSMMERPPYHQIINGKGMFRTFLQNMRNAHILNPPVYEVVLQSNYDQHLEQLHNTELKIQELHEHGSLRVIENKRIFVSPERRKDDKKDIKH